MSARYEARNPFYRHRTECYLWAAQQAKPITAQAILQRFPEVSRATAYRYASELEYFRERVQMVPLPRAGEPRRRPTFAAPGALHEGGRPC